MSKTAGENSGMGLGRRIFLSLFFLLFLGAGLWFTGIFVRSFWAMAVTHRWAPVECVMEESRVVPAARGDSTPELSVRYRYRYNGREFSSTRLSRGVNASLDTAKAYRLSQQLAPGTRTTGYVDPAHPENAVLQRGSLWLGFTLAFPLVFVAIGAGGLVFAWRGGKTKTGDARPISGAGGNARFPRLGLGTFSAVFLLFGLGLGYPFALKPLLEITAARNWPAVPCTIISSQVTTRQGDDGPTYGVEVVYQYRVDGRSYTAARYRFSSITSSGRTGKAAVVARLPAGKKTVCYVNPADPTDAVIERAFTSELWFGLIPLLFALIGAAGLRAMIFSRGNDRAATANSAALRSPGFQVSEQPRAMAVDVSPRQSRGAKLAGLIVIALFWNGIVSVFIINHAKSWGRRHYDWGEAVFLTPFALVGLFLLGAVVHQALSLSNPQPRLTLTPSSVPLGRPLTVTWVTEGKVEALQHLHVFLEGHEEATYRRGKNTRTDNRVFATIDILQTTDRGTMRTGSCKIIIPADTMHSWEGDHNRIVWTLRVRGEIPRWPDIDEEFPVTVLPRTLLT
jgi:hypothetical protein